MAQRRKKRHLQPSQRLSADGIAAAAPHAAPKYDMVSRRVLSLNARFPLLVLSAWLVLYAARPFYLGIYQDDWWALIEPVHATAPFSLDRLSYFVGLTTNYGPRPVLGFTAFIVTSLMGKSVFGLQCASIFLVLAAALSLRSWLIRLSEASPKYTLAADLAVIFWLALPWMLGTTAWPMVSHNLVAQILFTEAARMLLAGKPIAIGAMLRFGALLLASFLTYEAFYFAIFPVLAFYVAYRLGPGRDKRTVGILILISFAAQSVAIAFNRYVAGRGAPTKTFSQHWILGFLSNVHSLPGILERSVGNQLVWRALIASFAACALIPLVAALVKRAAQPLCRRVLGLLALSLITFLVSSFVYSLAGYGFAPFGMESRTLFSVSWSFTVAFFALFCCIGVPALGFLRLGLVVSGLGLITFLAATQQRQVKDWAEVWQRERRILAVTPIDEIRKCPPDSAILYIGPATYRSITVFGATWSLTPAVFSLSPLNQGRRPFRGMTQFHPTEGYVWTWDGSTLLMDLPGYWIQKFSAKHLYVWRVESAHLEEVQPGYRLPALK